MEAGREPIIRENRKINKPRTKIALDPVLSYRDSGCNYFYSAKLPVLHNYYKTLGLRLLF